MASPDDEIDHLYQGSLDGFVAARNALAKASKRPEIKGLEKPNVAAWAVNQIYWHHRDLFDQLVEASTAVRTAHRQALAGAAGDIHGTEAAHRTVIREGMTRARQILQQSGLADSPSTMEAIARTLEALPSPEATGRLTRPLSPAGLEALAGLAVAANRAPAPAKDAPRDTVRSGPATPSPLRIVEPAPRSPAAAQAERERAELAERRRRAEEALDAARLAYQQAQQAVLAAEQVVSERKIARDAAAAAYERAKRATRE